MSRTRTSICVIALLLSVTSVKSSEFTVNSLNLSVTVANTASPEKFDGGVFNQVQNPFTDSQSVALEDADSFVNASYDFAWNEAAGTGRFFIESSLAAEGRPTSLLFSSASNRINVTPSVPITVIVHGEYTFNLPVDHMSTDFGILASGLTTNTTAFVQGRSFDTTSGTGSGTFVLDGEFILPPTDTWQLRSAMRINAFSGTQGIGSGSGFFDIQIVPEPSVLAMLALGFLALARVPRRRSRT